MRSLPSVLVERIGAAWAFTTVGAAGHEFAAAAAADSTLKPVISGGA